MILQGSHDPKDQEKVDSFRDFIFPDIPLSGKQFDYHTLLRFLRMRDYDMVKAREMFLNYLKWREEFRVDAIYKEFKYEEYREVKGVYPHGFHGVDRYGRPIYIDRVGMVDINKLLEGMSNFSKPARYLFLEIQKIDSNYYPETLHRLFIINAGSGFKENVQIKDVYDVTPEREPSIGQLNKAQVFDPHFMQKVLRIEAVVNDTNAKIKKLEDALKDTKLVLQTLTEHMEDLKRGL
nr:phosphatidylinositol/phosphatidylcholine transfer protein SFH11 [Ipomoea batatas]